MKKTGYRVGIRKITGEAFWVGLGVFLSTLGTFVGVRLLTTVMSPDEYGFLALGMSIAMGLVYSIGVALWGTVTRFYSVAREDGSAEWYWASIRKTLLLSAWIFGALCFLLVLIMVPAGFQPTMIWFWILAIGFGGVQVIAETGSALQNGARNRKIFSFHQNLLGWGRFLLAFAVVRFFLPGATGVMLGFVLAALLVMFSQYYWVKVKILSTWPFLQGQSDIDREKDFFKYLKPLLYGGVFNWVLLFVDRWALKLSASFEDVGIYFALYQISFAPALYFSSFMLHFLGPILYNHTGDGRNVERIKSAKAINEKVVYVLLLGLGAVMLLSFPLGNSICSVLIDERYQRGFWAFPWLVLTSGVYSVGQQLLISVYSGINTDLVFPFRIVTTILALACYMGGGMLLGFRGIVGGGVVFSFLYLALSYMAHRHLSPQVNSQ